MRVKVIKSKPIEAEPIESEPVEAESVGAEFIKSVKAKTIEPEWKAAGNQSNTVRIRPRRVVNLRHVLRLPCGGRHLGLE